MSRSQDDINRDAEFLARALADLEGFAKLDDASGDKVAWLDREGLGGELSEDENTAYVAAECVCRVLGAGQPCLTPGLDSDDYAEQYRAWRHETAEMDATLRAKASANNAAITALEKVIENFAPDDAALPDVRTSLELSLADMRLYGHYLRYLRALACGAAQDSNHDAGQRRAAVHLALLGASKRHIARVLECDPADVRLYLRAWPPERLARLRTLLEL